MPKVKAKAPAKKPKIPKKGLLLPRPLSWSGLDLWERDPEEYKQVYFFGNKRYVNDAMKFGTHIADVLAGKAKPQNHTEQSVKLLCQKHGNPEYEIKVKLQTNAGPVELVGYVDDLCTKTFEFIENKTGTGKWTQKKADGHGQLHFYYLLVILAKGTRPRRAILQHLETQLDANAPLGRSLTGNIYPYEVYLDVGHELEIRRRIENAAREIDQAYRQFISNKK